MIRQYPIDINYKKMKIKNSGKQKVSVIIPTYNRERVLKKAIDSALEQNHDDIEIIVVDDGSTDNTTGILKDYGSKIKCLHQENLGVSSARNTGIKAASGDFIAFLDSDDHWLQGKLSAQLHFFKMNPNAKICQTEEIWIRNGKKVNPGKRHKKPSGMIFEKSLKLCLVSPSAVMLKKALLYEVGLFDEELLACEDYDLWLRISWKHPIFLLDIPLIIKTGGHADQLSKITKLDKFRIKSIQGIIKSANLSLSQHEAAVRTLQKKCSIYASGCLKRGKYLEAQKYIEITKASFLFPQESSVTV